METPVQTANRLLQAIAMLTEQEGMYLHAGYFDLAVTARRRATPLVERMVELARASGLAELQPRVDELLRDSEKNATLLCQRMAEVKDELRRIREARQRVAQIAPAYTRPSGEPAARFAAAG